MERARLSIAKMIRVKPYPCGSFCNFGGSQVTDPSTVLIFHFAEIQLLRVFGDYYLLDRATLEDACWLADARGVIHPPSDWTGPGPG
jgi:hypothetical protein